MPHTYVNCLIHCVFTTKNRANLIADDVRPRLWSYIGGIARENGFKALAVGGTANHVHALLALSATIPIAKALQLIKGGSSKWIHDTFANMPSFAWQEAYGAFSIGISGTGETIAYIEKQEEHHRERSFEEEFAAFLGRHDIEYDERYLWD